MKRILIILPVLLIALACSKAVAETKPFLTINITKTNIAVGESTTITARISDGRSGSEVYFYGNDETDNGTKPFGIGICSSANGSCSVSFKGFEAGSYNIHALFNVSSSDSVISYASTLKVGGAASSPKPSISISAIPMEINKGSSATITWSSSDSTSCSAVSPSAWMNDASVSGARTVTPSETTSYSIICTGPGGVSDVKNVIVAVKQATASVPVISFNQYEPDIILQGGDFTIRWTSSGAEKCQLSSGGYVKSDLLPSGSIVIDSDLFPGTRTIIFDLNCFNSSGGSASTIVAVPVSYPEIVASISAFPSNVKPGESSRVMWASTGESCSIKDLLIEGTYSPVDLVGDQFIGPLFEDRTVLFKCSGGGEEKTDSVVIRVEDEPKPDGPSPDKLEIISFTASPSSIEKGDEVVINWSFAGATQGCVAGGGLGWTGPVGIASGTLTIFPKENTVLTLTCKGTDSSTATKSVPITVRTDAPSPDDPAASDLIPCTNDCDFADFLTLINNVVNFILIQLALPVAAIMFAYAGGLLLFSGGKEEKRTQAKKIFTNTALGLIIIAASWLIVHTVLSILGYNGSWIGF